MNGFGFQAFGIRAPTMLRAWIMKKKIFTNYRKYIFKEPGNNLLFITVRIKHCVTVTMRLPDTWITNSIGVRYSNGKVTWRDLADHLNTWCFGPKTDFFSLVSNHHMNTRPSNNRTQIYYSNNRLVRYSVGYCICFKPQDQMTNQDWTGISRTSYICTFLVFILVQSPGKHSVVLDSTITSFTLKQSIILKSPWKSWKA